MTVCSRPEMIMKEAVKGCITMTSQLSLKVARPNVLLSFRMAGTQYSNQLSSECRSDILLLKLMNE